MKRTEVAAQLYTVRDFAKTPADVAGIFQKIREIGYEVVQVSGIGKIDAAELRRIADGEGLSICSTHESNGDIVNDTDALIAHLQTLGCHHTAYPYPHLRPATKQGCVAYAHLLNDIAKKFLAGGIELSYHNHALEFFKIDGENVIDIILREAPDLRLELDTFWAQSGGANPVDVIRRYPNRQPLIHLKDYGVAADGERLMKAIGDGNLAWADIIPAARKAGTKYFIVEQDNCNGLNPFDELKKSLEYLLALDV